MRALGRLCGKVLQSYASVLLSPHSVRLSSVNASPVAFLCFPQHFECRLSSTNSEQNEASLSPESSKPDSREGTQKLLQTLFTSLAQQPGAEHMDHLQLGKVVDSFTDMGFSCAQILTLFNLQPKLSPQSRLAVVSEFLLLGLSTDYTLKFLQKSPQMLGMSVNQLRDRADFLRKLHFDEESLNHVAIYCPSIFSLPQKKIQTIVHLLKEQCLFTMQQVSKILQTCPNILLENLEDLEYKFQYAYFRMGVKHTEIVKSGFFQVSMAEVKNRHIFLERLGLYQTPDKKGQTQVVNVKLKSIIRASKSDFVTKMACSSIEEYEIFKILLAREKEQEDTVKEDLSDAESDGERSDTE